jgi:hypoxanthine phosphoribosyltransferase
VSSPVSSPTAKGVRGSGSSKATGPANGRRRAQPPPLPHEQVRFAHNSERQFAKLLDFYGIGWEYEPRTFVLEWDREDKPQQAFSPDFYLPAYDLFIEITTMNQKLVTKKNRKARRLKELYPDIRIKVFYQRDYLNLLVKYGLEAPSQATPADPSVEPLPLRFDVDDHADASAEAAKPPRPRRRKPA